MRLETLEILRCPYCGGRLELVESLFHRRTNDEIHDGILGCHCCIFPVVDGVPVLHLQPHATAARDHIQAGQPGLARRTMVGLEDTREAEAIDAQAVVRSVAKTVLPALSGVEGHGTRRAIDICGGSGHLTRSLMDVSSPPPVLADLYYAKVWLARRFTSPGCEPVCCDGNAPFPFARGAFGFAMCTDAFMYIWTKRQFVAEMERLIATDGEPGAVLIGHTHNERTWSPSHGQPLSAEGYRNLFETFAPRVFGEAGLFADVVKGGPLDLSRRDPDDVLDRDPALTIVASRHPGVFAAHRLDALPAAAATGEFRLNPLYAATTNGDSVRLRLQFPNGDYADEYGACRQYLPDEVVVDRAALAALPAQNLP